MKIEIVFTNEEASCILWLLRQRYGSKAELKRLAKQAIRELVAQQAVQLLIDLNDEKL